MTDKQMQCLLTYLGYDPGEIDGIAGKRTQAALEAFRRDYGCGAEGLAGAVGGTVPKLDTSATHPPDPGQDINGPTTGTFWDESRYFTRNEFRCPCGKCGGFPVEPQKELVLEANAIREELGRPMIIVPPDGHSGGSGVRCQAYNATFPNSVSNSRHMQGKAIDFSCPGVVASTISAILEKHRAAGKLRYWYQITAGSFHADVI